MPSRIVTSGLVALDYVLQGLRLSATTGGLYAHVVADPQTQRAVCYLE